MALEQYSFGVGEVWAVPQGSGVIQPIRFGTVQEASAEFEFTEKPLMGQFNFPVDNARAGGKLTGKVKEAKFQASAFNSIFFGQTVTTGKVVAVADEGGPTGTTIPAPVTLDTSASTATGATLPFTSTTGVVAGVSASGTNIPAGAYVLSFVPNTSVTLSVPISGTVASGAAIVFGPSITVVNSSGFLDDLGVFNNVSGAQMSRVASAPAAGQYAVLSNGTYVFSAADGNAGVPVLISYEYTETMTGNRITGYNVLMGPAPSVKLVLGNAYNGLGTTLVIYKAKFNKLPLDFKNEDWTIPELDWSAMSDPLNRVYDWSSDQ